MIEIKVEEEWFRVVYDNSVQRWCDNKWQELNIACNTDIDSLRTVALAWLAGYDYGVEVGIPFGRTIN